MSFHLSLVTGSRRVRGGKGEGGGKRIWVPFISTGGELLKYTYTLFGGNYCLNGQKTKRGEKKKITVILGFLVAETSRKHHHTCMRHFWANPSQWWGQCGKMNNFLVT